MVCGGWNIEDGVQLTAVGPREIKDPDEGTLVLGAKLWPRQSYCNDA